MSTESHTPGKSGSRRPSRKKTEANVYGLNACLKAFTSRPQDVLRLFFVRERSRNVMHMKKWCADHKLPYRQVTDREMERLTKSVHHEGVLLVMRPPTPPPPYKITEKKLAPDTVLVAFDRVENTHNLGALLRSCAFFGVTACILSKEEGQAALAPSAVRMAEGGLDAVPIYECSDLTTILRDLKDKGAFILGTAPEGSTSLYTTKIKRPCVVVIGNEATGLSERVRKRCDAAVHIPGTGKVQSLNVSVALGVVLSELTRPGPKS